MENLWCKIECLRQRMHVTAFKKGISHPNVLMISQILDEMLNELYKMSLVKRAARSNKCVTCHLTCKLCCYEIGSIFKFEQV